MVTASVFLVIHRDKYLLAVLFGSYSFKALKELGKIGWVERKLSSDLANRRRCIFKHFFGDIHYLLLKKITRWLAGSMFDGISKVSRMDMQYVRNVPDLEHVDRPPGDNIIQVLINFP